MSKPLDEEGLGQNIWSYAYEEIMSTTLIRDGQYTMEEIEARAREIADRRLAEWRAGQSPDKKED